MKSPDTSSSETLNNQLNPCESTSSSSLMETPIDTTHHNLDSPRSETLIHPPQNHNNSSETLNNQLNPCESTSSSLMETPIDTTQHNLDSPRSETPIHPPKNHNNSSETLISEIDSFNSPVASEMTKTQELAERQHEDLQTMKSAGEINEVTEKTVDNQTCANKESGMEERDTMEETGEAARLTAPVSVSNENLCLANLTGTVDEFILISKSSLAALDGRVVDLNVKMTAVQDSQNEFVIKVEGTLQDTRKISMIGSHHKKAIAVFSILFLGITILMAYNLALFKLGKNCMYYAAAVGVLSIVGVSAFGWMAVSILK